jgi:hypothetical protein
MSSSDSYFPSWGDDPSFALELIRAIVDRCPRRQPGSTDERRAHDMLAGVFDDLGLDTVSRPFRYNTNLYANLALHFGLGTAGSLAFAVSPALAMALHGTAGISYLGDSTRRFLLLRRLLGFRTCHNLLATLPAADEPALRVVLIAHADAAFTGALFDPRLVERLVGSGGSPAKRLLAKPMRLAAYTQLALAGVDGLGVALGPARHLLWPAVAGLSIPGLLVFLLNLEIVLRNEIVPGANDNLSGCAGLALLANRLVATRPDDVELVFVIAGAEEAGTGGSRALAHQMRDEWSPSDTIVLGVDGLSGGELCYFHEGDIFPLPIAPWLRQQIEDLAASQPRFAQVAVHEMDVGATDAGPFQAAGYDAVCIGRVDRALGSPRHYHHPTDTPDNLDMDEVLEAVDFIELLVNRIIDARRGPGSKI